MKKPEIIDELAKAAGLTKEESAMVVETVFECIMGALVRGEKVELRGFGRFRVRQHGARTGWNPKVGRLVHVPATRVPHFKPGQRLRNLLNAPARPVSVP